MSGYQAGHTARVLVTGASGFLGGHVVTALLDRGYRVVAHQNRRAISPELKTRCERIVSGDICDPRVQEEVLQDVQVVCHLAAFIPTQYAVLQDAVRCYTINAQAVLELAAKAIERGVRRFIHFSTGNMYAASDCPCAEENRIFPAEYATDYMASKLVAELYLTSICQPSPMDAVILRIATPYGPGEPDKKVIPTFLRFAAQGHPLSLVNEGLATYNFVYVADIADLTIRAIESGSPGIYNVASGEHTSLLELADSIIGLYREHEVPLTVGPLVTGSFSGFPAISIDKARKEFGFSPCSLIEGLRLYRASIEKNESLL